MSDRPLPIRQLLTQAKAALMLRHDGAETVAYDALQAWLDADAAAGPERAPLDVERLARAMRWAGVRSEPEFGTIEQAADQVARDYDRLPEFGYRGLAAAGTDRPAPDLAAALDAAIASRDALADDEQAAHEEAQRFGMALREIAALKPMGPFVYPSSELAEAQSIARRALDGPEPVAGAGTDG